jgi:hypothetical protein
MASVIDTEPRIPTAMLAQNRFMLTAKILAVNNTMAIWNKLPA